MGVGYRRQRLFTRFASAGWYCLAGALRRIGSSDGPAAVTQRRSTMNFVIASQIALWIGLLILGTVCMALARQIGVLHQRIAPAGALSLPQPLKLGDPTPELALPTLDGSTVKIGGVRGGRSQLLLFLSPDCAICETLLPALRSAQGAERSWLDVVLASDG